MMGTLDNGQDATCLVNGYMELDTLLTYHIENPFKLFQDYVMIIN